MPIDLLTADDIDEIVAGFAALGWPGKDRAQYERYVTEQAAGDRVVLVARIGGEFAGYGTVKWLADYQPFRDESVPEVQDLNVLPRGITYRGVTVEPGETVRVDDDLALMMTRRLR
jgi:hypothetical protein